jgi:hypothetical protein
MASGIALEREAELEASGLGRLEARRGSPVVGEDPRLRADGAMAGFHQLRLYLARL